MVCSAASPNRQSGRASRLDGTGWPRARLITPRQHTYSIYEGVRSVEPPPDPPISHDVLCVTSTNRLNYSCVNWTFIERVPRLHRQAVSPHGSRGHHLSWRNRADRYGEICGSHLAHQWQKGAFRLHNLQTTSYRSDSTECAPETAGLSFNDTGSHLCNLREE